MGTYKGKMNLHHQEKQNGPQEAPQQLQSSGVTSSTKLSKVRQLPHAQVYTTLYYDAKIRPLIAEHSAIDKAKCSRQTVEMAEGKLNCTVQGAWPLLMSDSGMTLEICATLLCRFTEFSKSGTFASLLRSLSQFCFTFVFRFCLTFAPLSPL
jgi:hypothetical protein